MAAVITRQIRIGVPEFEAMALAAPRGEQTRYIIKALRAQLIADGYLAPPEPPPLLQKMNGGGAAGARMSAGRQSTRKPVARRRGRR